VLACGLGGVALTLAEPPVYAAQSTLYVDPAAADGLQQGDGLLSSYYVSEATSQRVLERVIDILGWNGVSVEQLRRKVSAQPLRGTNVIVITAEGATPADAATLANALASAEVAQNQVDASGRQQETRNYLQGELDRIKQQLQATQSQPQNDAARQAQLTLLEQQYITTYGRLQDLDLSQAKASDAVTVLEQAKNPPAPVQPKPLLNLALALAAGLLVGPLLALAAQRLDRRVAAAEALGRAAGVPLLATANGHSLSDSLSLTQAHLLARFPETRVMLVIPAGPGDSAREVARLLAVAGEQAGKRVRLVHLAGLAAGWRYENGHADDPPSERKVAPALAESDYDLAVVSAPSPIVDPAAALVARQVDVAVLVGTAGRTDAREARRSSEALRELGVKVEAAVLLPAESGRARSAWIRRPARA
jgi:capsular polysaccharide biosynthesis protein